MQCPGLVPVPQQLVGFQQQGAQSQLPGRVPCVTLGALDPLEVPGRLGGRVRGRGPRISGHTAHTHHIYIHITHHIYTHITHTSHIYTHLSSHTYTHHTSHIYIHTHHITHLPSAGPPVYPPERRAAPGTEGGTGTGTAALQWGRTARRSGRRRWE